MNINLNNLSETNKQRYSYCLNLFQKIVTDSNEQKNILDKIQDSINNKKILVFISSNDELKNSLSNLYTLCKSKDKLSSYYCQNIFGEHSQQILIFNHLYKNIDTYDVLFFDGFDSLTEDNKKRVLSEFKDVVLLSLFSNNLTYNSDSFDMIDLTQYNEKSSGL